MLPIVCLCAAAPPAEAEPGPYGVMGDVGLPDGMVGSLAYRAHPQLDLHRIDCQEILNALLGLIILLFLLSVFNRRHCRL